MRKYALKAALGCLCFLFAKSSFKRVDNSIATPAYFFATIVVILLFHDELGSEISNKSNKCDEVAIQWELSLCHITELNA